MQCDVFIIGGGPAGYAAARRLAQGGLSVVLAEKDLLGGTCLNRGCIPTKLLLGATSAQEELAAQQRLRLASGNVQVDLAALMRRKATMLAATRKSMAQVLTSLKVTVLSGAARLDDSVTATVQTQEGPVEVDFEHCIVAAGSRPIFFPGMEPDGVAILDSDQLLELNEPPASLIIVGGGFIGLEMGQVFHRLGASITIVDAAQRIAPGEDPEVSAELAKIYARKGWTIHTGRTVTALSTVDGRAELHLDSGETLTADKALVSVGRGPVSAELNLKSARVEVDRRGFIVTDPLLLASQTVTAVGDVNGRMLLAHAAEHQAHYAAGRILAERNERPFRPYDPGVIPSCIYGNPEAMRAGKMAHELAAEGLAVEVSSAALAANPIAQAHGSPQGFVKIAWVEGRVAGVCAVGFGVSQFTTLAGVMVRQGWTSEDVEKVVFPHPSLDEAVAAALNAPRAAG